MKNGVYLAGGVRTAIGTFCGSLESIPAPLLGSVAAKAAVARAGLSPDQVDEVIVSEPVIEKPSSVSASGKSTVPIVEKPPLPAAAKTTTPDVAKTMVPILPAQIANASVKCVSVNTASMEELAAIKDLCLGVSILAKVCANLKL